MLKKMEDLAIFANAQRSSRVENDNQILNANLQNLNAANAVEQASNASHVIKSDVDALKGKVTAVGKTLGSLRDAVAKVKDSAENIRQLGQTTTTASTNSAS